MRIYKESFSNKEVDLDDPKTFSHLPDSIYDLEKLLFEEIGYSYWYINFVHYNIYKEQNEQKIE